MKISLSSNRVMAMAAATAFLTVDARIVKEEISTVPDTETVSYKITFLNRWIQKQHPVDYPSDAHWSPPIFACHSNEYTMWNGNMVATQGVQDVAEFGGTFTLRQEMTAAGAAVLDTTSGAAMFGLSKAPAQAIPALTCDPSHSKLSGVSMIAPSPDWFGGAHDVELTKDGYWYDYFQINAHPYDAGTDDGTTYRSRDKVTTPPVNIFRLTPNSVPSSGVFVKNGRVRPVIAVHVERMRGPNESCMDSTEFRYRGKPKLTCRWLANRDDSKRAIKCLREQTIDNVAGNGDVMRVSEMCPMACGLCSA